MVRFFAEPIAPAGQEERNSETAHNWQVWPRSMLVLEELHCTLVLFSFFASIKRAQILSLTGPGIFLARVESILA